MILVIAEKPSLGRDIADVLPGMRTGNDRRYIEKGEYVVTWVFGHMLTLKEPEDYDKKYKKWSADMLPIYFEDWGQKIGEDSGGSGNFESKASRVKLIGELLSRSASVIHAGDPDEEGQLLIDELLRWFHYDKPVMRLDTGDTTQGGLQKALGRMKDNSECVNEGWSAYARSVADLMVGVNMSRFFTCSNPGALLTVGRVQTPTLGLVVARDMAIEGHTKTVYYDVYVDLGVETPDGVKTVRAKYQPKKKPKKGEEDNSRILSKSEAEEILSQLMSRDYTAVVERKTVKEDPPLPFNLVKLQSYCSSHFGYNPQEVMDITQSLREKHKAITYNRSDCQYLSEEHFKEAPKTMEQVIKNISYRPKELDMKIHSKCFNDKNITAHFAIIPTNNTVSLDRLTEREKNVYLAVCKYYMAQFLPKAEKEKSRLTAEVDKEYELCATSARVIKPGYLAIFKDMKREEPTALSDILPGTYNAKPLGGNTEEKETKPPARYTKATLNEDMTRIAKYVSDPKIKKLLELKDKDKKGENGSIGTSATRSTIIDGLVKKGYLEEKGKKLISTPLGRELYRILPDEIKKADMTAEWWAMQEDIRCGKSGYETLTHNVLETIERIIKNQYPAVDQTVMSDQMIKRRNSSPGSRQIEILGKCPMCGGNVIEGTKGYGCANWKPPMSCKFVIWKKHKSGMFKNQNFTKTMVKKWLARKPVTCKKLTTKTGNIFEADVSMRINPAGQYGPVEFDLTFKEKKPETPKATQIQEEYAPDSRAPAPPLSQYQPPEELPPDFWG
ncbi:MAG: DNA topoisomerase [Candidatus Ornithomonoglobus sp.]